MAFIDKGGKGKKYLTCDNGRRRVKCKRYTIRYDEVERLLLDNAPDLRPDQVLPDPDAQSRICFSLRQRIVGNEEEIENIEAQVENLVDQIARTRSDSMRDRYENKIAKLTEQKKALGAAVETDQAELQKAQGALKSLTNWKRNLATLKKELQTGGVEIRMRLQAHLREMIERVEIFAHGEPGEAYEPVGIDRTGKGTLMHFRRDNGDWHVLSQEEGASFLAYVDKRRNSKEGRFIRVYFKSGAFAMDLIPEDDFAIDLVPDGSLASGLTFSRPGDDVVDAWDAEEPSFDRLYREFQAQVNL
jgi:hypothetical protein